MLTHLVERAQEFLGLPSFDTGEFLGMVEDQARATVRKALKLAVTPYLSVVGLITLARILGGWDRLLRLFALASRVAK